MLSLAEALAALPDTADGIAAHLTALGIRGVRFDGCNCPVTNYLTGLGFDGIDVDETRVRRRTEPRRSERVAASDAMSNFVRRFDRGEWPELVLDDAAEATDA